MMIRFKPVDHRNRTECRFVKRDAQPWGVESKPTSAERLTPDSQGRVQIGRTPPSPWVMLRDGRQYLQVPGLTLHWEKVTPVLDRIALMHGLIDAASGAVLVDDPDDPDDAATPDRGAPCSPSRRCAAQVYGLRGCGPGYTPSLIEAVVRAVGWCEAASAVC